MTNDHITGEGESVWRVGLLCRTAGEACSVSVSRVRGMDDQIRDFSYSCRLIWADNLTRPFELPATDVGGTHVELDGEFSLWQKLQADAGG